MRTKGKETDEPKNIQVNEFHSIKIIQGDNILGEMYAKKE
jgi:hypothetical protein